MRFRVPAAIGLSACVIVHATQSGAAREEWPTKGWPSAAPQEVGLDPKPLNALDADIAGGKYGNVDSMLVIRHGRLAFDRSYKHDYDRVYGEEARKPGALNAHDPSGPYNYFNPWWHPFYHRGDLHTMQSVTKTVTSVVIGIATARKEFPAVDTPVLEFFDAATVTHVDDRKRRMTIKHLLTMTAGFDWNEDLPYADPKNAASLMEASFDWVRFAIDRPMAAEPGATFRYNSGATQILSHIFRHATGHDIEEYADRHLFAPLGIDRYFWKRTPTGLADTEGGLYLRPHDLAKIAYLFLKNGVWDGTAIVQPDWVKASLAPSIDVSSDGVKYGYKWWLYPYGKAGRLAFGGSGFGGQRPIVLPDLDLVMVFTGWNILPGRPSLGPRTAIDRVLQAVSDR
jgi:CubicO group peptidase (beta-lactamase class C family)